MASSMVGRKRIKSHFPNQIKNCRRITVTTRELGIWLNGRWLWIWDDLANPKKGLNLVSNPL
jgi:hypothetical protein